MEAKKYIRPVHENALEDPSLGVLRLDYHSESIPGEIDHPDSFGYDVHYRVVPGLTFEKCQAGYRDKALIEKIGNAISCLHNSG